MNRPIPSTRGYTLYEIVIAVGIVAILIAGALTVTQTARQKSRDMQRLSDMEQISIALRLYRESYGSYPPNATNGSWDALRTALVPEFLAVLPNDPLNTGDAPVWAATNQNTYYYWGPGSANGCGPFEYTLWYRLELKTGGTAESCVDLDDNSFTKHP